MTAAYVCSLLAVWLISSASAFPVSENFSHSASLSPKYQVYWKFTGTNTNDNITFEIHVATRGWVGFGFSPNGGMAGGDMIVGGVWNNGTGYLWDRNAEANGFPVMDAHQDYDLLSALENATHTVLKFRRKMYTCDRDDYPLNNDTIHLIFASNDNDAASSAVFPMHTSRSTKSAYLFVPQLGKQIQVPADAKVLDLTVQNVALPNDSDTEYWCKIIQLPDWKQKHHLIRYEPVIQKGNEGYTHHILVYHCLYNMSKYLGKEGSCRVAGDFEPMRFCSSRWLAVWAVGGEAVISPENMGTPMFEKGQSPYVMLEIHYNNANLDQGVRDSSGMRLYFVQKLRPIDIGALLIGQNPSPEGAIVPPGQKAITLYGFCTPKCTETLPASGIQVFRAFLHTHLQGISIRVRHIRKGVELPPIAVDDHYDFNYQNEKTLTNPVTILPNDALVAECTYGTLNKLNTTFGGFSTHDEMCFAFLEYYPRTQALSGCTAFPSAMTIAKSMQAQAAKSDHPFDIKLTDGSSASVPQDVKTFASNYKWSTPNERLNDWGRTSKAELYQKVLRTGTYGVACSGLRSPNDTVADSNGTSTNDSDAQGRGNDMPQEIEKDNFQFYPSEYIPKPAERWKEPNPCNFPVPPAADADDVPLVVDASVKQSGGNSPTSKPSVGGAQSLRSGARRSYMNEKTILASLLCLFAVLRMPVYGV